MTVTLHWVWCVLPCGMIRSIRTKLISWIPLRMWLPGSGSTGQNRRIRSWCTSPLLREIFRSKHIGKLWRQCKPDARRHLVSPLLNEEPIITGAVLVPMVVAGAVAAIASKEGGTKRPSALALVAYFFGGGFSLAGIGSAPGGASALHFAQTHFLRKLPDTETSVNLLCLHLTQMTVGHFCAIIFLLVGFGCTSMPHLAKNVNFFVDKSRSSAKMG